MAKSTAIVMEDAKYSELAVYIASLKAEEKRLAGLRGTAEAKLLELAGIGTNEKSSNTFLSADKKYKFGITVTPTFKVDEEALSEIQKDKWTDAMKEAIVTKHSVATGEWGNLTDAERNVLSAAVSYKFNKPSIKIEEVIKK